MAMVSVRFPVRRKGTITYDQADILNITSWAEIHAHFKPLDARILPYECYQEEELRPDWARSLLEFHLKDGVEIPDTLGEEGGASGGMSKHVHILPAVISQSLR
jgi:hypothetical protein